MLALLQDPFCLTPGFAGPKQPLSEGALYDPDLESWTAPFIMAPINTRNVHRSNFLQAHAYGADLAYDEMLVTGPGDQGEAIARSIAADAHPMRGKGGPRLGKELCPEARQAGGFDILFIGVDRDGRQIRAAVTDAESVAHNARYSSLPAPSTKPPNSSRTARARPDRRGILGVRTEHGTTNQHGRKQL